MVSYKIENFKDLVDEYEVSADLIIISLILMKDIKRFFNEEG